MEIKEWAPIVSATAAAIASIGSWYSIYTQGKRDKKVKKLLWCLALKILKL